MQNRKISPGQLLLLLLLARLMHTMIYRFDEFTSGTPLMLGLLITTAVECIISLPVVIYYSTGGASVARELFGKNSKWAGFLYSAYFTVIAGGTVALFADFLHREFSDTVAPVVAIILLAAVAAYCARLGIEGLARAGTVVFWLFVVLFALMAAVSEGQFDWLNVRPLVSGDAATVMRYITRSLSSSWWIPMLCVLGEHLRSGAWKVAYGFLALKLLIIGALFLLITLVLWRYVGELGYPIFALGAYSKSGFIQRFDAINMLVWAINCAIVTAVYIFISARPVKRRTLGTAAFAVIAAAMAIYEYKRGLRYDEAWFLWFETVGILLLGVIMPTAALILKAVRKKKGGYIE